jgi:hypothetical protein
VGAAGPDVSRSAAGRLAGETIWTRQLCIDAHLLTAITSSATVDEPDLTHVQVRREVSGLAGERSRRSSTSQREEHCSPRVAAHDRHSAARPSTSTTSTAHHRCRRDSCPLGSEVTRLPVDLRAVWPWDGSWDERGATHVLITGRPSIQAFPGDIAGRVIARSSTRPAEDRDAIS